MEPENQGQVSDNVSLSAPEQPANTGVSLSNPVSLPGNVLPDEVANLRAEKTSLGIGKYVQKTAEDIKAEIQAGREDSLRRQAAAMMDVEKSRDKLARLTQMATAKGGPIDENDYARVMDPFNPNNKPIDPNSVTEAEYAAKYVSTITDAVNFANSLPAQAQQENPEEFQAILDKGADLTTKMEGFRKIRENWEAAVNQQSTAGYVADTLKNMFQPYVEAKMRSNTGGLLGDGLLLGDVLKARADQIFSLPKDEAIKQAIQITDDLGKDNPQLAVRFAGYLEGLPRNQRLLDSTFTAISPLDYAGIVKGAGSLAKGVHLNATANQAVRQLVEKADIITNAAQRAEAAGDLATAATERGSQMIMEDLNGTRKAIDRTTDPLLTFLNQDKEKIGTDFGNLSTEQVRRIQDQYTASGSSFISKLVDAVRINRIPMPVALRNSINILKDAAKDYYVGIKNTILDVSDPLYEPKSNTFWHDITFGNFDGTLFSNPQTAKNFAEIHNLGDVQIVEGHGPVTNADMQNLLNLQADTKKKLTDVQASIEANRLRVKDTNLTPTERENAAWQEKQLSKYVDVYKQDLKTIELRMEDPGSHARLADLSKRINELKAQQREVRGHLVKSLLRAEEREILQQQYRSTTGVLENLTNEYKALKSGNAQSINRGSTLVKQEGVGYKIVIRRPLVETDHAVRDLMVRNAARELIPEAISTSSQQGLGAIFNGFLWRSLRSSEDTLALNESIQRKIGTYTQSLFKQWAYEEAQYIKEIASGVHRTDPVTGEAIPYWKAKPTAIYNKITGKTHGQYGEFIRTLEYARDAKDPVTGLPGYFFETPGQLNNHYLTNFQREATYAEHQAYFAYVRMIEGDRILREVAEFRNRARLGVEQFSLNMRDAKGRPVNSPYFDARRLKKFPGGDDVVMITGFRQGQEKLANLGGSGLSAQRIEELRQAVKDGRLIALEIYAPEHRPLQAFSDVAGDAHVRYIITDRVQSKPIEFNHVNRRGGGHFEYDYDHFLKQADFYHQSEHSGGGIAGKLKNVYLGDKTFMPLLNRVMGQDIARKLGEVQRLIKSGDMQATRAYIRANLPMEPHELIPQFQPGRDANGKQIPARLSLEEPFVVVPKGKTVRDVDAQRLATKYGDSFKDIDKSGSLNRQFQVAYNTERESSGLVHWEDIGSRGNPIYKYAPTGKMIDPITTMNRSLNRIVNTAFMDDYKIYAVEHWLREAEPHLEPIRLELARSSPFWVFHSSLDKSAFTAATPPEVVRNLLSNRFKINQFLGVPSTYDTAIQSAKQWLVDTAYNSFGPESKRTLAQKAITIVPNWMLGRLTDPITFLRSMTFHEKLGLFNPAQFLVQAQTYATIFSLSPRSAVSGSYAAMLHTWARLNRNPEILEALDRAATKISLPGFHRWKPGEFREAMEALDRTGFENVAGEYSNLNTALKTDFVGNDFKSFLNAGTVFFRGGEKSTRIGAWYTAFKEFREANPIGALTRDDIGKILQRADLLTVNMSRASNSALNSGVLSLTTQFLTYQVRLAELFMGKRLGATPQERAMARFRLLTFYSALYGAPSAIGLTGLPMQNSIRTEAVQRGYTLGDNWLSTALDQGIPAMVAAHITGGGDFQKGNLYNIGSRFGSPGFTQLSDALKSDHAWWQLLAGASGTTLLNTLTATMPFFHRFADAFRDNKDRYGPLKLDDLINVGKEVSSVNQAWKLLTAINTGKWMSKNEGYIGDVSAANAAFMAVFGLSPSQQDISYIKKGIMKSDQEYQKYISGEIIKELRRSYQDQKDKNMASAKDHQQRAFALMEIGGLPMDRRAAVLSMAAKGYESMIDQSDYAYAMKNVPTQRGDFLGIPTPFTTQSNIPDTRREQFRRQIQLDKKQGQ